MNVEKRTKRLFIASIMAVTAMGHSARAELPVFVDSGQLLGNSNSVRTALGDLDGDGDLDAYIVNAWNRADKIWLNDGDGFFSDSGQNLGNSHSVSVDLGDLDGDLDAFVTNMANRSNEIWLNDGNAVFTDSGQRLGNSDSTGVSFADLDRDGDLDAFVSNGSHVNNQPNKVWLNDGSGTFSDSGQNLGNSVSNRAALEDLDGDGDLDAFVPSGNNQPNKLWLNDGSGIFTDSGQNFGNSTSSRISLGDLDGDGDLDAFVSNFIDQPNKVWLNQSPLPPAAENCEQGNQAVYDPETAILDIPYVDIPVMNPITGALTGEIAVFEAQLLKAAGINDFSIIPGSFGYMDLAADYNPLHAQYTYADDSVYANGGLFHMPCVYVPSIIVIPPGIQVPGPVQIYEVTLRQLAAEPEILHLENAVYIDTIPPSGHN
ncbi:MAG: VCBS repeat-containing protein [Gammaproteobacteria bacterium]|nr:VCBS repeat-containing protein [Gammaproteobacteria bacterium]